MPYIKEKENRRVMNRIIELFGHVIRPNGNLNYFLFALAKKQCKSYNQYKEFIGELECAMDEIKRRQLHPYEDNKIKQNGDVIVSEL